MKICPSCEAANPDSAKFCNECGSVLTDALARGEDPAQATMRRISGSSPLSETLEISETLEVKGPHSQPNPSPNAGPAQPFHRKKQRRADILFVLDCTGSMQGEIDAIRDAIINFAETIEIEQVRARVGLIAFRDRLIGEESQVLQFQGNPFTTDPQAFRQQVLKLQAEGGGDEPESSLDALMLALQQPFDEQADKVIVLVTDAPPHIPDAETQTMEEVVEKLRQVGIRQLYLVIRTAAAESQLYLKLLEGIRGLAFDLGRGKDFRQRSEDFKRTLMQLGKTITSMTR